MLQRGNRLAGFAMIASLAVASQFPRPLFLTGGGYKFFACGYQVVPQRGNYAFGLRVVTAITGAGRLTIAFLHAGRIRGYITGGYKVMSQRGNHFRF